MVVIVDIGLGNLGSIRNMLLRVGANPVISSRIEDVEGADRIVLPGVGAFDRGMVSLIGAGLDSVLTRRAMVGVSILGLCLGMHLMCRGSEEGVYGGLNWLEVDVVRFEEGLRVPHVGWGAVTPAAGTPLLASADEFYFTHSYRLADNPYTVATAEYGGTFPALVRWGNIVGAQFHPEKSHKHGKEFLKRWLNS